MYMSHRCWHRIHSSCRGLDSWSTHLHPDSPSLCPWTSQDCTQNTLQHTARSAQNLLLKILQVSWFFPYITKPLNLLGRHRNLNTCKMLIKSQILSGEWATSYRIRWCFTFNYVRISPQFGHELDGASRSIM